jgi:hypothetical protein
MIATAGRTGLIQVVGDNNYYTSKNNRFQRNAYQLGCQQRPFAWKDPAGDRDYGYLTPSQWKGYGNDRAARLTRHCR